jgi:hypothetical protein
MRATPINDFFAKNGKIRIDGRMFEVKKQEPLPALAALLRGEGSRKHVRARRA